MNIEIPVNIIREIIFDILFERANRIDDECSRRSEEEMTKYGFTSDLTNEIGWTACGTRVLADEVKDGNMSIEESLEVLTEVELEELKSKCLKWYEESKGKCK